MSLYYQTKTEVKTKSKVKNKLIVFLIFLFTALIIIYNTQYIYYYIIID